MEKHLILTNCDQVIYNQKSHFYSYNRDINDCRITCLSLQS
jgi:hypothetical protein